MNSDSYKSNYFFLSRSQAVGSAHTALIFKK